ncbi:DKNYY domain-containing protein [Candidatus Peregrinibacteria bacterium]|nr:MAG: DKNYY domain-containing protein [Candidatus Peregrinibacteria bacterium]
MKQAKVISPISQALVQMTPIYILKRQYETLDISTVDPECKSSDTWQREGAFYIKDGKVCLWARRYYPEIDGDSFEFINHSYVKDKNHVYVFDDFDDEYGGMAKVLGADVQTFEPIGHYTVYAKDKDYIYGCGRILTDADINSFEIIDNGFAKDIYHVYRESRIYSSQKVPNCSVGLIKSAKPETFNLRVYSEKNFQSDDDLLLY